MFKQLSQIGKNLSDELQKGLSDDMLNVNGSETSSPQNGSAPSSAAPIDESLPQDVQMKLRKLEKYESKYPSLLNAYKIEKMKNEKFAIMQKILTENTPVADLSDIEITLPAYFEDISNKNKILNEEITRLNKLSESTDSNTSNSELLAKYKQEIDLLKEKLSNSDEATKDDKEIQDIMKAQRAEIANLNKKLLALGSKHEQEIKNLKRQASDQLDDLRTKKDQELNGTKSKLKKLTDETNSFKIEADTFSQKLIQIETTLKEEHEKSDELLKEKDNEINKLKTEIEDKTKQIQLLQEKIETKDKEIEKVKSDLTDKDKFSNTLKDENHGYIIKMDELKEQCKSLQEQLKELQDQIATKPTNSSDTLSPSTPVKNTNTTGSKKNKNKKKNKKGNQNTQPADAVPMEKNSATSPSIQDAQNKYAELQKQYDELRKVHESCEDWKLKFENVEEESLTEKVLLQKELDESKIAHEKLSSQLQTIRTELKAKSTEVEEVRDMLREVGNELVDAKDQLKDAASESKESKKLQANIERLESDIAIFKKKEADLMNTITSLNKDITDAKELQLKERTSNQQAINMLRTSVADLQTKNKSLLTQTKELSNLKSTVVQKEKTITYLENQVKEFTVKQEIVNKNIDTLKRDNLQLKNRIDLLKNENQSLNLDLKKNSHSYEDYIKENGKLSERLSILQEKYDTLQELKSNSSEQINSIRRQCEELNVKLKESNKRIISLEDELNEYTSIIQDKTKEADNIRRLLSDLQNEENEKQQSLETKLSLLSDEKSSLKSQLALQSSKHAREIQDWKHTNDELLAETQQSSLKLKEVTLRIEELEEMNRNIKKTTLASSETSSDLEKVTANLKAALSKADSRIHELQKVNAQLLDTNNNINKKLDKLTKTYKTLSSQFSALKENRSEMSGRPSRSNSMSSQLSNASTSTANKSSSNLLNVPENDHRRVSIVKDQQSGSDTTNTVYETEADKNERIAYIKNVLLGFLEHKEQRNQLLPVVSILLQLDSNDEKRLLTSIS